MVTKPAKKPETSAPKKLYKALMITSVPHGTGPEKDKDYSAQVQEIEFNGTKSDAKMHFTIETCARQRALRGHAQKNTLVRFHIID